jgi:hypothetical protein
MTHDCTIRRPDNRLFYGPRRMPLKPCALRKGWGVSVNWETTLCFPTTRDSGFITEA